MTDTAWQFLAGFAVAFVLASLVEYVVHILMHRRIMFGRIHTQHHKENTGQGWLLEFKDYFLPSAPAMGAFWVSCTYLLGAEWAGWGMVAGGTFYAMFAAYAHQLQHEHPELVFWMRRPVHTIHHDNQMWRHNFGIAFDVWDRVFGTYRIEPWEPTAKPRLINFVRIKWLW